MLYASPPVCKLYRISSQKLAEVKWQLEEYINKSWIFSSSYPYSAPILFVGKKLGELHTCVHYRELNNITCKDRYPLLRINKMFDILHGSSVFLSLDLYLGYNQLRIKEGDKFKTAFQTRYGLFEFFVLPSSLYNSPSTIHVYVLDE